MGEKTDRSEYNRRLGDGDGGVHEWEIGLPSADDLTSLSQPMVPPDLASAFSISPEPAKTILDVHRASQSTLSSLRRQSSSSSANALKSFSPFASDDSVVLESDDSKDERVPVEDQSARALKRPRLVWTPQLHKRFVDVVAHLGIKNAMPKTIMQLMNVEGLTRENVASHLQKYRLYLKRMQGLSIEGSSASDPLFALTPVPQSLHDFPPVPAQQSQQQPHQPMPMPMPFAMIPMPMFGMPPHHNGGMGMIAVDNDHHGQYQHQHPFGGFGEQRSKDWASGSKFGTSVASYPSHVTPNGK